MTSTYFADVFEALAKQHEAELDAADKADAIAKALVLEALVGNPQTELDLGPIEMHDDLKYWRPDQVAECIDGINDETYGVLWSFVPEYDDTVDLAPGEFSGDTCMSRFWKRIPRHIQEHLNERIVEAMK